jgi:hypothetical protein
MSTERYACCGCVMSDGRFAVLGGWRTEIDDDEDEDDEDEDEDEDDKNGGGPTSSCKALAFDGGDAHWAPLLPMHDTRSSFACGAVAEYIIVAGGFGLKSAELYDAELNRWLRLPCDLPYDGGLSGMGSAVL